MTESAPCRTDDEIRGIVADLFHDDVRYGLAAYRLLTEVYLPWTERKLVWRARQAGKSWTKIGRLLGRSRQAVQKRFDHDATLADLLPPSLPKCDGQLLDERLARRIARMETSRWTDSDGDEHVVAW